MNSQIAISPGNPRITAWGHGNSIESWDIATSISASGIELPHNGLARYILFHPRLPQLTTLADLPEPKLELARWDLTGRQLGDPQVVDGRLHTAAISKDGVVAIALRADEMSLEFNPDGTQKNEDQGQIVRVDTEGKRLEPALLLGQPIMSLAWSKDGKSLIAAGYTGRIRRWTLHGKIIEPDFDFSRSGVAEQPDGSPFIIDAFDINGDGDLVVVGGVSTNESLGEAWRIMRDNATHKPLLVGDSLLPAAFTPDGSRIFAHDQLWDFHSGQPIGKPISHHYRVTAVAFSPRADIIATGSGEDVPEPQGEARLFQMSSGKPLGASLHHPSAVRKLEFDSAGQMLLTLTGTQRGQGGRVRVYDTDTGRTLGQEYSGGVNTLCASLHPSGKVIVTGGTRPDISVLGTSASGAEREGLTRLWSLSKPLEIADGLIDTWATRVTRRRLDEFGVPQFVPDEEWFAARAKLAK